MVGSFTCSVYPLYWVRYPLRVPIWQLLFLFLVWLGVGLLCWKRRPIISERARRLTRGVRIAFAFVMLIGSAGMMLAGLMFMAYQTKESPFRNPTAALGLFAMIGATFVAAQSVAGITLFTILEDNVTTDPSTASIVEEESHTS